MSTDVPQLTALQAWLDAHPAYAYTAYADERVRGGAFVPATLRIAFDAATQTETVRVVRGNGAGSEIRWRGGTAVDVRGPGVLHALPVHMNVRDPRLLSPRGNDVRTGDFARVLACFAAAPERVRVEPSAPRTSVIALVDRNGIRCGDEDGPGTITEDRLTIDASDGHPVMRERLDGSTVVERWRIGDLRV